MSNGNISLATHFKRIKIFQMFLGDEMISSRLLLTYEKGRDGLFKSFKCLTKEFTHKHLQKSVCYHRSPILL